MKLHEALSAENIQVEVLVLPLVPIKPIPRKRKNTYRLMISPTDVGHTAAAYAKTVFEVWQADGVVTHPYIGSDSIAPFLAYGKDVLLMTGLESEVGQFMTEDGKPVWQHAAEGAIE